MRLVMLGTGHAMVTKCYNTCFILQDDNQFFMVDAGGGNGILLQLNKAGISWKDIKNIFITHKHIDHLLGIIWIVRLIGQSARLNEYSGTVMIYAHEDVIQILKSILYMVIRKEDLKYIEEKVHYVVLEDGETREIIGHDIQFFDIHSTKDQQFGFTMEIEEGRRLTCCGDEPFHEHERIYLEGSTWLMHEAFCLFSQAAVFQPYEKHHSTVKDACQLAEQFCIENLILYHTEDTTLNRRKELYTKEGQIFYHGNLYIPDDLAVIEL